MITDEEMRDSLMRNKEFYMLLTAAMLRSVEMAAQRYGSVEQAVIETGKVAVRVLEVIKGEPVYMQFIALESLLRAHVSAATEPDPPVEPPNTPKRVQ